MSDLDKELGALDIDDERDRVVDGHASRPVAFGDKGGEPATSAVPHGEVDDKIKVVFLQVVHDAALLLFSGTLTVFLLLKRPVHCCHLKQEKLAKKGQTTILTVINWIDRCLKLNVGTKLIRCGMS